MVESEAQGRLPGIAPVSVVDIGSNSIRLVIYEGMSRSPAMLFNEKVMCGLGKGLARTGRMNQASVERALAALHRFKALSRQARASTMFALATAAAREAENGPDFIHQAEMILGFFRDQAQALKIVDPVMGDEGKLYSGVDASMAEAMRATLQELYRQHVTDGGVHGDV